MFKNLTNSGLNYQLNPTMIDWSHKNPELNLNRDSINIHTLTMQHVYETMRRFQEGEMGLKHIPATYVPMTLSGEIELHKHKTKRFEGPLETTVKFYQ